MRHSLLLAFSFSLCGCVAAQNQSATTTASVPATEKPVAKVEPKSEQPAFKMPASSAQVWLGGSRAWPDLIAPGAPGQWRFLADNVDGFYLNNFALRLTDKTLKLSPEAAGRAAQVREMRALLKNPRVIYETDLQHSTDAFDRDALNTLQTAGFTIAGVTINRGTTAERSAVLTENGRIPLYYMFGPWRGGGDILDAQNDALRAGIMQSSGGAVDGPVTMWRKNAGKMKPMVYSSIGWSHAQNKKFLYLLAPNESGSDFLLETKKLAHDLEDNNANPDIWAVSFYGPPTFREKLETLPEALPDGAPAQTFSGAAYWLLHHLRDPDKALRLAAGDNQNAINQTLNLKPGRNPITLSNSSRWLDLAPVVRARFDNATPKNITMKWMLGERDVTAQMNGDGVVFNGDLRLQAGEQRTLILEIGGVIGGTARALHLELLPHPSTPIVEQTLPMQLVVRRARAVGEN